MSYNSYDWLHVLVNLSRVSVHARERQPRFFFNGINLTVVENDLAILKVKDPETLECKERIIWPACLPVQVC